MTRPLTAHRPGLGILLKVAAIGLFTVMSALIKAATEEVPIGQAVFFRSFCAIPIIMLWLLVRGELRDGLIAKHPMGHVWRGVIGTSAMGLTFVGLSLLPLPEVTAIGFATPIFTLIFAAALLGETIRMVRISAVVIGLVGVTIMLWPRLGGGDELSTAAAIGAVCVLVGTMLRGLAQIHIRRLVQSEHTAAIVFYFSITASALGLLTLPFGWVLPSNAALLMLITAGLIGGVAQILITSSYRFAPASLLAPYDYVSMIFAVILGYFWFSELPTVIMLAGAALVICGNVVVIWRESRLGLVRGKARPMIDMKGG
ncbi:DMT family transporter [Epibacterium ulvae]|uniref:DMT family transporter n=1 Tax=Epibacterium ulvae TaxID=1156985 RepID=UPI0024939D4D|nr:DMT family transporter [Epibacterium ulvae]